MNHEPVVLTKTALAIPHCSARTPGGRRCRMAISDPESGLCFRHAAEHKQQRDAASVAALLIGDAGEFTSAVAINRSLGELYKLLARDEIAPRRAAVMAYTCSLLLRTLPAIGRELHPPSQDDQESPFIVMDIDSAVARRAQEAQRSRESERHEPERAHHNSAEEDG